MEESVNQEQVERSRALLGEDAVEMLLKVHQDAIWILENLGLGCKQPEILEVFNGAEEQGSAVVFEDRIYLMSDLVQRCLGTVPGVKDFFVPLNSFFIGGAAPYVYDVDAGKGGGIRAGRLCRHGGETEPK
jgi:trimethylamine--corrinoid protein Co-methyltransferase